MLNKGHIMSIKRDIFCFDFLSNILGSISFLLYILERKDKMSFKRHICCFNFHSILSRLNEILLF